MTPYAADYEGKKDEIIETPWKPRNKAKLLVNLGIEMAKAGRAQEAHDAYKTATRVDPSLYGAWINRAALEEYLGRGGEAIVSYDRASKLPDDRYNNHAAAKKAQELQLALETQLKRTVDQAEKTLKEAKLIPESEPPPRAKPDLTHEDALASFKRSLRLSLEEREKLNERYEYGAVVFDELFASKAVTKGDEMVVTMSEDMWNQLIQELIDRGRRDVAAEDMPYCVRANPSNLDNWKLLIELLGELNEPSRVEAAKEGYEKAAAGEAIDRGIWYGLGIGEPK
jgi:tetratricopeptide (TPR) repeat protein